MNGTCVTDSEPGMGDIAGRLTEVDLLEEIVSSGSSVVDSWLLGGGLPRERVMGGGAVKGRVWMGLRRPSMV